MITILLPTHRPQFFEKALFSVLHKKISSKTISQLIINCDNRLSKDNCLYIKKYFYIIEKYFPNFKVLYNSTKNNSINKIYYDLIKNVETEYFYFLEDDDILLNSFDFLLQEERKLSYYFGLYKIHPKHEQFTNKELYDQIQKLKDIFKLNPLDLEWFQLGQVLFKTEKIKWFPKEEHSYNDFYLVKNNPGSSKLILQPFFEQGWSEDSYSQNFFKGS